MGIYRRIFFGPVLQPHALPLGHRSILSADQKKEKSITTHWKHCMTLHLENTLISSHQPPSFMRSITHVILNPVSGAKTTEDVYENEVLPLLNEVGVSDIQVHRTESEGDAGRIASRLISGIDSSGAISMVLLGGDGTTHEVVNGIVQQDTGRCIVPCSVKLALVPTGTANALYASLYPNETSSDESYKLKSVRAMISPKGSEYPLALSAVSSSSSKEATIAHLITSHALHASILADSEALRSTHPGIERFKLAAAQNMTKWTLADVRLKGKGAEETIELYDADTSTFKIISSNEARFTHPIFYFVCVTTDRLEPTFVPAPLSGPLLSSSHDAKLHRPKDAVDIVVIRPLRDPALKDYVNRDDGFWLSDESNSIRGDFASRVVQQVIGGMYNNGKHIAMHYDNDGPLICEYFRCGGYEWTPVSDIVAA
jgi:diacylglycerol kinase family enzyme